MRMLFSQPGIAKASLIAAFSVALLGSVAAAPVPVIFEPPALAQQDLCTVQPNIDDVEAKWRAWDRVQPIDVNPELVLGEIQRLRDADAPAFKDAVAAAFSQLGQTPDVSLQQRILVDQIRYQIAAGDAVLVKSDGLVERLATSFSELTPRSLFALAELFLDGKAVAADAARGEAYLLSAAAGGSPDALLRAAQMRSNGELAGYGLDPKTAVTIAFGAILGGVDAELCSRISRIARNYESGEIVQQNYPLAERWLRLAADLGDPGAAWKVARYHLTSERIVKDNDTLLKYLAQAADAQIPQAQVELGEFYQDGALLAQDLDQAETLFQAAAKGGYRIGNMRLVALLESRANEPGVSDRLETALRDLSNLPDAPSTALVKLSDVLVKREGRWAAQAEVQPLLERAVEQRNPEAALMLADVVLSENRDAASLDRAISLLNLAVSGGGKSEGMARLSDIYMCMVPGAPNLELATRWHESALAAGNGSGIEMVDGVADDTDLAQAQSLALRGSAGTIAQYVEMLRKADYGEEVIAFWERRIEGNPQAQSALAKLLMERDQSSDGVELSINLLQSAVDAGSDAARVTLAKLLLGDFSQEPDAQARAISLLKEAALHGSGAAIATLSTTQPDVDPATLLNDYGPAIDARGDVDAFLFAAQHATAHEQQLGYLALAVKAASCNFNDVIKIARGYSQSGNKPAAEQWLGIATHLVENQGWQFASLAQEYTRLGDNARLAPTVVGLLEEAVKHGQVASLDRLIDLRSNTQSSVYDPAKVVALVKQAVETATPEQLLNLARRIERARPDLRDQITQTVDIQAIYQTAAEGGNATAMRELAKYLQQRATGRQQLGQAMDWMEKAATERDPEAMLLLAKAYTVGLGREASLDKAVALLEGAAELGNDDAKTMLRAMGALQTQ
ncbi:MAG: tetratricopeptide repeat protein [Devosia sp.]